MHSPVARMSPADPHESAVRAAMAAVLAHLAAHPQAADTAGGVARWWVGDDAGQRGRAITAAQVRQALDRLVAAGRLRREVLADGTELYAAIAPSGPPEVPEAPTRPPRRLH